LARCLIGSIRRECLDHVVVLGEPHLRRILTASRLLPPGPHSSLAREGCPRWTADPAATARRDSPDSRSWTATCDARRSPTPASLPPLPPAQATRQSLPSGPSSVPLRISSHWARPTAGERGHAASHQLPAPRARQMSTGVHRESRTRFWRRTAFLRVAGDAPGSRAGELGKLSHE
jgi:hypothetical protein